MITEQQTQDFKQRLLEMRADTLNFIQTLNNDDRGGGLGLSLDESIEELASYDNHPADVGTEVFERSKDLALKGDAMLTVRAIDDALTKLANGQYGLCEVCGKEIPLERLEAVPYTTQCVDCKAKDENLPQSYERTAEEDVLEKPFARSWQDDADYNGFDGEDAWETVARWNEHADRSQAGSYYGDEEMINEEHLDTFTDPDSVPYEIGADGIIYESFRGLDDEGLSYDRIDIDKTNK
ncbi:TraR/DksA C4-type zinc finger protein [Desulforamulus ferrireducens]|uniref:Conjugal transfer protein TraR n=1 Tax=Desulforamulus ferrireducens TaxID=1833852 RepID=A0A1S6IW90_9FIRM|nr:TraR/DksA C4-type zinc finger protein [Desulforamulus ferrireducens]AQS59044.1 conjugal transfer protein TraR [Desulforamulus ferrireducens]